MNGARTDRSGHGPGRSTDAVLAGLDPELSRFHRLRYLAVGLASLVVTAVAGSLWATEGSLPLRTRVALGGITVLAIAWTAAAAYVLTQRRPLYASDRVLATGMAVVATSAVGIGATLLAGVRGGVLPGLTAGTVTLTLVTTTAVLHLGARRRRHALITRRRELEER